MMTLTVEFLEEKINECHFMLRMIHNKVKFSHPLMSVFNEIKIHLVPIYIPLLTIRKRGGSKSHIKVFLEK